MDLIILDYEVDNSALFHKPCGLSHGQNTRTLQHFEDVFNLPVLGRVDKQNLTAATLFASLDRNNDYGTA